MRILGIDPGIGTTGWSILDQDTGKPMLIAAGMVCTDQQLTHGLRLVQLRQHVIGLIEQYLPTELAIERLFFAKNITTAMTVSEARGIILCAAAEFGLSIAEYSPPQIKQAITGYGKATKRQLIDMLPHHLPGSTLPTQNDAADAIAISVTHFTFGKILDQTIIQTLNQSSHSGTVATH
ncbi:crossover junction endodeoxyribonuclease RuvC [Candidatus Berkelbacteria bacterium]|nr:crossover junction endodeoxyribonuclease RuvC [Candidatus Berkelbacteria bacterium]